MMATAKKNPFAKFEKSKGDKESKGMREGSKKEVAKDKKQFVPFGKKKAC